MVQSATKAILYFAGSIVFHSKQIYLGTKNIVRRLPLQVFNLTTYPNFVEFLEHLGVDTEPSNMSFSLSMDDGALEWASHDLGSVFAQRKNLLRP